MKTEKFVIVKAFETVEKYYKASDLMDKLYFECSCKCLKPVSVEFSNGTVIKLEKKDMAWVSSSTMTVIMQYAYNFFEIKELENITLPNYHGTWHSIKKLEWQYGTYLYLLESEQFGDETQHIIVDQELNVIKDDVWNGFNDLLDNL